ncbi:MAG: RluA family pseudouridine synthase [Candidatus Calescibacterium sp.]|nr:RluA family pseudouridine synthase [Candidatus Calescibacterium sp.]MDW8132148.1 RluA family pseudouridine synthase [Candidatus Calescibacterium sp.]
MKFVANINSKLIDLVSQNLKISKNKAKDIIDQKRVFVNKRLIWIASYNLKPNDLVEIAPPKEKCKQYDIIYEDENFIAVSKGPGFIVNNSPDSLENILRKKFGNSIKAIHRIDKDTTGIVLFAKNSEVFYKMKEKWNTVEKTYYCISINEAKFKFKEIDYPIGNKKAISTVILISKNNGLSLFKIRTFTGRKHQIRIHLKLIGFPILGDYVYGPSKTNFMISRQMLHAYKIQFNYDNRNISLISPIPEDMQKIIKENGL